MNSAHINALRMAHFHRQLNFIPDYEAVLEKRYRQLIGPSDCVIDVGAHSGRHTAVFSQLVGPEGKVIAFEPLPEVRDSIERQPWVTVYPFALSDDAGTSTYIRAKGALQESGLRKKIYNQPDIVTTEQFEVELKRLDDFASDISNLSFIKIDVEGNEIAVLNGARSVINEHRPFITVEYGRPSYSAYGHNKQSLFNMASSLGYVIGDLFGSIMIDNAEWEHVCDLAYWDWFLVPRERRLSWQKRLNAPSVDDEIGAS
jgi:FkbM family methyltransferase